jgi:hypothetical protein
MNSRGDILEDPLRKYINPDMNVKAPAGFTSKVMTQIQMERLTVKTKIKVRDKNPVPYISATVTLILVAAAFLLQGEATGSSTFSSASKLLKDLNIALPKIDFSFLSGIRVPEFLTYVLIGLFILAIFDQGLNRLFRKRKSQ